MTYPLCPILDVRDCCTSRRSVASQSNFSSAVAVCVTSPLKKINIKLSWVHFLVVALLAEWSLPTPEACSSNPVIGEVLKDIYHLFILNCIERRK